MSSAPTDPQLDDVLAERDFLACLVELLDSEDPTRLVAKTLGLLKERAGAERAYLELGEGRFDGHEGFWASAELDATGIDAARAFLSKTIIAETLASGLSVETASAVADPRFNEATSVRRNRIEAVLCVPVGAPTYGVIYLQGHTAGQRFPSEARAWMERFAAHLRPVARRLLEKRAARADDPTLMYRARLIGSEALVGKSAALAAVLRMTATIAPLDVPVLLTGPSGTGKSELARIIALSSGRRDRPLVTLNCAAIPDTLLESELFGAFPGAHSTATKRIPGRVEVAAGGTLFLDEVSELSPSAQAKLLQLLQDGTYWPLGAAKPLHADVRLIAATNAVLSRRVAEGRFREDLYYRLNVINIEMPGLDARRTDIPLLAEMFVAESRDRHGLSDLELSAAARHALLVADWPGHVRQLANALLGAAIRAHAEGATSIEPHHIFHDQRDAGRPATAWHVAIRECQRKLLTDALEASGGNMSEASRRLGIARSYTYELVKDLGIRDRS